jgi:pimeloyl-ACP methyl ester carboxylesterase
VAAGRPVLVVGNSLGATVALHVVSRCPADGLIVRNPPPLREAILDRYGWWNLGAHYMGSRVPRELCALTNSSSCHVPALFLTSGKDRIVPPKCQQKVFDAYAGPKQRFHSERAGHDTPLTPLQRKHLDPLANWLIDSVMQQTESYSLPARSQVSRRAPTKQLR